MASLKHQEPAVSKQQTCATEGCKRPAERPPPCVYCEECSYDQLGEEIERHPIGAVYNSRFRRQP